MARKFELLTKEMLGRLTDNRIFFRAKVVENCGALEGGKVTFDQRSRIEPYVGLFSSRDFPTQIGACSYSNAALPFDLEIGRYCSIANGLKVMGRDHPIDRISTSPFVYEGIVSHSHLVAAVQDQKSSFQCQDKRIVFPYPKVGNDVWIGQDVTIGRKVIIGNGAVVAAGSVVTKSVAPYSIVGGNPARVIRMRFPDNLIDKLQSAQWWRYLFSSFSGAPISNSSEFCDWLADQEAGGVIKPYEPGWRAVSDLLRGSKSAGR